MTEDVKHCRRCDTTRPVEDFAKNARKRDGLQCYCRPCYKAINADTYRRLEKRRKKIRQTNAERIGRVQAHVLAYLREHPCVDCGEADVVVLDFDHVRGQKVDSISALMRKGFSILQIDAEIAKCEVRCANDHRRKTASTFGWYRLGG